MNDNPTSLLGDVIIIARDGEKQRLYQGHVTRVMGSSQVGTVSEWELSFTFLEQVAEVPMYEED